MTLQDALCDYACRCSRRRLRRFLRWQVVTPANDNRGGRAA